MTLGEKIRLLRKGRGLSQSETAAALGVPRQTLAGWEKGEAAPENVFLTALAQLFDVTTEYLLDGEAPPEPAPEALFPDEAPSPAETFAPVLPQPKKRRRLLPLLAGLLALTLVLAATAVFLLKDGFGTKDTPPPPPPEQAFVLVHGLGGWGDGSGMNSLSTYWGADTGDLAAYLREQGYEVATPSVGPISSTWDRCCELYAILTGGTVDYGEAHAAAHRHRRYGRTYETALLPDWGENKVVNLIGHSFGGATVRAFADLLAYGAPEEVAASGEGVSPLFTGDKAGLVHSVTTLCAPHNGSSLTCVIEDLGAVAGVRDGTQLLAAVCFAAAGLAAPADGVYDFMLDQFGIGEIRGGLAAVTQAIRAVRDAGNDHAGYELTPDGAAQLNAGIDEVPGVYYFSYAWRTTRESDLFGTEVPVAGTLPVLAPFALAMGAYRGTTAGGIEIGDDWRPNDGLVSVVSAACPADAARTPLPAEPAEIRPGIWNVAETRSGDHGTVIGMRATAEETHGFYESLFELLKSLPAGAAAPAQ